MMTMNEMKLHFLVQYQKKRGKVCVTMGGLGTGIMRLWALQNTTSIHRDTIIFDEDGWVLWLYEGTGDFPKITEVKRGDTHIDEYCKGLLEECKKSFQKAEEERG